MCKDHQAFFRPLSAVLAFLLLFSLCLPPAAPAITIQEERDLGEKILQEIQKRWSMVQEPAVNEFINRIGQGILRHLEAQPFHYQFFVINSPEINAFAVPGGKVFVNSGLILLVENEDELAGVMAHEIGHVVARHIAKRSEQGMKLGLATLGAMLAGLFLGGQAAGAIATTTLAASQTAMLKYSREDEEEADHLGLKFMDRAGYNRQAMTTMLKKLRRAQGPAHSDPPPYLLTHPAIEERISNLEIQMAHLSPPKEHHQPAGNLTRLQTNLVVAEKDIARGVAYFQNWLKRQPENPEAMFGLGLAQKRMGALDRAIENLSRAASLSPRDGEMQRELGAVFLLKANLAQAQKHLEGARSLLPFDPLTHFYLGRVYAERKDPEGALQALLRAKELKLSLPELYYHLGLAYGAKNLLGPAYQSFGIYYKLSGDSRMALLHFQKALPFFQEPSAELKAIREEIEELTPKKPPAHTPPARSLREYRE